MMLRRSLAVAILSVGAALDECNFTPEIVFLEDASGGFIYPGARLTLEEELQRLGNRLRLSYDNVKLGIATFVDKPLASLGWYPFQDYIQPFPDWCYRRYMNLTADVDMFAKLVGTHRRGYGVDVPEGQYEGVLRAALDPFIGWTPPEIDWFTGPDAGSKAPLRILVTMTNSEMHIMGEGQTILDRWERDYGSPGFCISPNIFQPYREICRRAGQLRPGITSGTATPEELAEWAQIESQIGPMRFPRLKKHPGNLINNEGCSEYDYPDWPYMITVLEERKINPILVYMDGTAAGLGAWYWLHEQYAARGTKITSRFILHDEWKGVAASLERAITDIAKRWCEELYPKTTTTRGPKTTEEATTTTKEAISTKEGVGQCTFNPEVVIVEDSSGSRGNILMTKTSELRNLAEGLAGTYKDVRIGITTFVDKPMATLGWYPYQPGAYSGTDWCYKRELSLTNVQQFIKDGHIHGLGHGADPKEAQYEAMLRTALDPHLGWTRPETDWFPDSTAPLRLVVVVTDSDPHVKGDAQAALDEWEREYGTPPLCDGVMISEPYKAKCGRAGELKQSILDGTATPAEQAEWAVIESVLGPMRFPRLQVHPGNLINNDNCTDYDYPDWHYVVDVLEAKKINPIFVHLGKDPSDAWSWLSAQYTKVSSRAIIQETLHGIAPKIEAAITEIAEEWCRQLHGRK